MMHFPLSVVCVWFSHWPLERSLNMRCTMSLSLPILYQRGQCRKWLETNLCYQKYHWENTALSVMFDMHRDTYPSIHSATPRIEKCSGNRRCRRCISEIWCWLILIIDICFFVHSPKTTASLPLRNYSNDLQQCMFSYSLLWEYENAYWHLNYLCKAQTRPSGGNHHVWSPQSLRIKEEPGQTHIIQTSQTGFAYKDKKQKTRDRA